MKHSLKQWLETFPDKITFGTDTFPSNGTLNGRRKLLVGLQSSRTALAKMIFEGEVDEAQALRMAHGYLHDDAVGMYEGKAHRYGKRKARE